MKKENAKTKSGDDLAEKMKAALETAVNEIIRENQTQSIDYFHKTEKLLYAYPKLKCQLSSFQEYSEAIFHQRSKGIVHMPSGSPTHVDIDDRLQARYAQFDKTRADIEWIEQALKQVKGEDGYRIIELRYFEYINPATHRMYTWEDIAEALDYPDEHQVRRRKNQLIHEIALYLFGTDSIGEY